MPHSFRHPTIPLTSILLLVALTGCASAPKPQVANCPAGPSQLQSASEEMINSPSDEPPAASAAVASAQSPKSAPAAGSKPAAKASVTTDGEVQPSPAPVVLTRFDVRASERWGLGLMALPPATVRPVASSASLPARVLTSGVPIQSSPGGKPQLSLKLPAAFEMAASGKSVRVTISARSGDGTPLRSFAVTYSTNEVGNSGWRKFSAGSSFADYSFEYAVPRGKDGRGDFVGILPDTTTEGGVLEVQSIAVEIVP